MTSNILDLSGSQSPETQSHVQTAYSWAKKDLEPCVPKHWEEGTFPPHILTSFAKNCPALLGFSIKKCYGGAGLDILTSSLVLSALASVDASFATTLAVQYGLASESILMCGDDSQKKKFLPRLARLEDMGCFCLTEPQSGSDASDLHTKAFKVENGYFITGSKRWIGNALTSEVFIVWARNMSLPGDPIMGFIVQKSQQSHPRAIVTNKITGKTSMRILQNANVDFNDAWCPNENVMHAHVGFAKSVGRVLEASRITAAWIPVGISIGALAETIDYTKNRHAFNAPLCSNQLVQEKLARMTAMTSSSYLLAERVTNDFMKGKCRLPAIAMMKAHVSRTGREVVSLAREMLGGNGIVLEYLIASKFADMESAFTYEGTYDINVLICGRAITGVASIKSGLAIKNEIVARSKL